MSLTGTLAELAVGTKTDDIPAKAREAAKKMILDTTA